MTGADRKRMTPMHRSISSRTRLVAVALGLLVALVLALIAPDAASAFPRGFR
jgi:hypothetical protein